MGDNNVTMKQIAVDTGVPYSTIRSWSKSRPELHDFLINSYISWDKIDSLQSDIAELNLILASIHKQTEGTQ